MLEAISQMREVHFLISWGLFSPLPCPRGEADGLLYQEYVRRAAGKPSLKAFRVL
jgi:hypothetical protein